LRIDSLVSLLWRLLCYSNIDTSKFESLQSEKAEPVMQPAQNIMRCQILWL